MFEEEAKKHKEEFITAYISVGGGLKAADMIGIQKEQSYKEGAEFAYNKANEWHYVKDGLPKTSGKYLVYTGDEPFILDFATEVNSFGYWVVSLGDDWGVQDEDFETVKDRGEDDVIAWKEIILPELEIENDQRLNR